MNTSLAAAATVAAILACAGISAAQTTNTETAMDSSKTTSASAEVKSGAEKTLPSGTKYTDVVAGTGAEAQAGKVVAVHYTGTLTNGKKFDSSKDRGKPFRFPLGDGKVIKGWDEGVAGMKAGGVRKLVIPPDAGYGPDGRPPVIPPNATLLFDVELIDVQ